MTNTEQPNQPPILVRKAYSATGFGKMPYNYPLEKCAWKLPRFFCSIGNKYCIADMHGDWFDFQQFLRF